MKNTGEERCFVIVDIDGTLSIVGDRKECLERTPKNWDEFYDRCGEDEPNVNIIKLVYSIWLDYRVVLVTGRRESCRYATKKWLVKHGLTRSGYSPPYILMRPDNDYRHDTILKPELLKKAGIGLEEIAFVLEDRNSMVKKWRELGVTCLQVAEGDF
jgi:hypothetical protein